MINLTIQISYNPFFPSKKKSVHLKHKESLLIEAWPLSPMHGGPPCQAHLVWLFSCYGQNFLFRLLKILEMLSVFLPRVRRSCIGIEGRVHLKPWQGAVCPTQTQMLYIWNVNMASKPEMSNQDLYLHVNVKMCPRWTWKWPPPTIYWAKKWIKLPPTLFWALFVFFPVTIVSKQVPFIELSAGVLSLTRPPMILILVIHQGLV